MFIINILHIIKCFSINLLNNYNTIVVRDIDEVYDIIRGYWGVQSFQVKFKYNDYSKFYEIALTNKLGETFAWIGDINFNPYE
jgi:hypothetical protein